MDAQDFRSLQEAYLGVYQELDEAEGSYEPDPFGRPGGKYGGVKKGGGYEKGYNAMMKKIKELDKKEEYNLYDIILSHLLDEGYADTQQAAEAIMVNMSEDWREDIVEASVDYERPQTDDEIEKARNERRFGKQGFNQVGQTKLRRQLHKSQRGVTKKDARRWEGEK